MTTETKKIDRAGWPSGPWDGEPDRIEWRTAAGLPALMRRTDLGIWCGYCAVPPGHPAHGQSCDQVDGSLEVHGGITYAKGCQGDVCHVPAPGEPDDVWWLGFDAGHYMDVMPGLVARLGGIARARPGVYRDAAYVRQECESLAKQLAGLR